MATRTIAFRRNLIGNGELSIAASAAARILIPPLALCAAMLVVASVAVTAARVEVWPLLSYFNCAAVTLLCVLVFVFIEVLRLAVSRAANPLDVIKRRLLDRLPMILLPALVLPAFLIGYTAAKCSIPFIVGYTWDEFWANADRLIFGQDVWRLARSMYGGSGRFLQWFYSVGWGSAFLIVANAVAFYGGRRIVGIYFTAMFATWLIGGCLMAYQFSAAGPVFAHMFDPALDERFRPLRELMAVSPDGLRIDFVQRYLAKVSDVRIALKGGGISAMPSMHIGAASIYILAARRTKWFIPAILFWLLVVFASGYFGFHYWVDGIVAAAVAAACWLAAEFIYPRFGVGRSFHLSDASNTANGANHTSRL